MRLQVQNVGALQSCVLIWGRRKVCWQSLVWVVHDENWHKFDKASSNSCITVQFWMISYYRKTSIYQLSKWQHSSLWKQIILWKDQSINDPHYSWPHHEPRGAPGHTPGYPQTISGLYSWTGQVFQRSKGYFKVCLFLLQLLLPYNLLLDHSPAKARSR